ncbi:MAG: hypothetical protein AABO57_11845 [Acidobacteriota bacterium]
MSSDQIQRQIDFILEQQAKFDARFDEKMLEIEEKQRQNTEDIVKLVGAIMNLTLPVQENSRQIAELIEHGKETDRRIAELAASGKETDVRLNSLIEVVERYFSDGQKSGLQNNSNEIPGGGG